MPGLIYTDPVDAFDLTHFHVMASSATPYQPNMPKYFIENNVRPFYEQEAGWNFCARTPRQIVEMLTRNIEFFFDNPKDKPIIATMIKAYVDFANRLGIAGMVEYYQNNPRKKGAEVIPMTYHDIETEIARCNTAIEMIRDSHNARIKYYAQAYPERFGIKTVMDFLRGTGRKIIR